MGIDYHSLSDIYYAGACLIFICAGVFGALIRALHYCPPYGADGLRNEHYPTRHLVVFFYATIALQIPYLLHPSDPATWLYIRLGGIIYYPVCFATLFQRYFRGGEMRLTWGKLFSTGLPLLLIPTVGIISQTRGEWLMAHARIISRFFVVLGILLVFYYFTVMHFLKRKIDRYHRENYSSERDFPYRWARIVIHMPLLWIIAVWALLITGSRDLKIVCDLYFAFSMVLFLPRVLRPQRLVSIPTSRLSTTIVPTLDPKERQEGAQLLQSPLREEERVAIRRELADIIKYMYRDSGLMKSDVIAKIDRGRKTLARTYISEVGFYNLVNTFRLEHARLYKEAHPTATQDEIAMAAGFRDRFALSYAKKKTSPEAQLPLDDFHPDPL